VNEVEDAPVFLLGDPEVDQDSSQQRKMVDSEEVLGTSEGWKLLKRPKCTSCSCISIIACYC